MVKCVLCNDEEGKHAVPSAYPVGENCALSPEKIRSRVSSLGCTTKEFLTEYRRMNPSVFEKFIKTNPEFRLYI